MAKLWSPPGTASEKGKPLSAVTTPTFVVQRKVAERNCRNMMDTCRTLGVKLRAQTKTHKTIEGAALQTGGTLRCLVASTLDECEYLADRRCDDLLYGYPLTPHHMPRVRRLTQLLQEFHVLVDSREGVAALAESPPPGRRWSVFLKVDCGGRRVGVWHEDLAEGVALVRLLTASPHIVFKGVYVHCGDTYEATTIADVEEIRNNNVDRLMKFVDHLQQETGQKCDTIGIGSTPSCRRAPTDAMKRLTELHPGNYIFLDVQQHQLGSCQLEDIACCVATRVIGHYPHRNQLMVDCGFTALTKQGWGKMDTGFGVIKDHPNLRLCKMTQEIGLIEPINTVADVLHYDDFPVGSLLFILPYHSCATAAMYSRYLVVSGDDGVTADAVVEEEWHPTRGW